MQFRVLGPLEADHRGEPIDLGSPKQREVLSFLLMHAGRSVSADRIIDAVWGDTDGQNPLYIAVSRLRSAFDGAGNGAVLTTQNKAYTLEVDPRSIDAERFEELARAARRDRDVHPGAARAALEEALDLWRGPAWEDVRYRDFALADAERLEELRAGAVEDLLDLRLSAGETTSVVADARAHHEAYPLRERPVELLMVALYRSGRQAEALQVFTAFARALDAELGLEPSPHLRSIEEHILLHDHAVQEPRVRRAREANPYQGLLPFREEDAAVFFGRDRLVAEVVGRLAAGTTLVTVVGASGSGKSSIVGAGVVPAVRSGAVPGAGDWRIATMVPGANPFAALEAALIQALGDARRIGRIADEHDLLTALLTACPDDGRLLLVVDQFEELFTLTNDESVRAGFLAGLTAAVDDPSRRIVVVLTLRADHYELPLEHPRFAERFARGVVNVGPMQPEELQLAATEPAGSAGIEIDPALVASLVADVAGRPGSLPLFQYTLTQLVDAHRGALTLEAYHAVGGVAGALTRQADNTFARFDLDEQEACRQLFLRMVAIGADGAWARRRLSLDEARGLGFGSTMLQSITRELVSARLVTTDRDAAGGGATIEVAHESLLGGWGRLAGWLEEAAEDIERHRDLALAVDQWRAAGEDESYLWEGRRLTETSTWERSSRVDLSDEERRFLATSRRLEEEAASAEARAARMRRTRIGGLVVAVVALVVVGTFALLQWLAPAPVEVLVLDAPGEGDASAAFVRGLDEVERRLGFGGAVVRPGIETGAEIQAAIRGGPSRIVVARNAGEAFPAGFWNDLADRATGIQIFDMADPPVAPAGHPGWTQVLFADEQAAFVAGALAATRTQTGVVGHVGASSGHLSWARAGFEAGVASVDPGVEVVSSTTPVLGHPYAGFRSDAADRAYATTRTVLAEGADVVFHTHGDAGAGVLAAIADARSPDRPIWAIGHGTDAHADLSSTDPELAAVVLTSVVRRYDRALLAVIGQSLEEKPARITVDASDGAFEIPDHGEFTSEERALVADLLDAVARDPDGTLGVDNLSFFDEAAHLRLIPRTAPALSPEGATVVDVQLETAGIDVRAPEELTVGQTLAVDVSNNRVSRLTSFVAVGRVGSGVTADDLPEEIGSWVWLPGSGFDVQLPRDWALVESGAETRVVAVVDEPGLWVVVVGILEFPPDREVPVTWVTFDVTG